MLINNCKKIFAIIIFLGFFSFTVPGQYFENREEKPSFKDKLFFGGGLGLQFGQVTIIDVSPMVGYKITNRIQPGIGLTYSYSNDKRYSVPLEFSTYGGSVFLRFFIYEGLFAYTEAEFLNTEVYLSAYPFDTKRQWVDSYYVGAGYFQKIGEKSGMYFMLLWNLNQTQFSPQNNPVMRIGFNF